MALNDNDLLARLNALKQSSVTLQPAGSDETPTPQTVEDKLADRLKSLRSGGTTQSTATPIGTQDKVSALISRTEDDVTADKDPIRDWQDQDGDEQTLEELLAELGPDDQWKLDPDDPKNINALLNEARQALPRESEDPASAEGQGRVANNAHDSEQPAEDEDNNEQNEDRQDNQDADEYVKIVLAELEFESKHGIEDPEEGQQGEASANNSLDLPSTPSSLPQPPATDIAPPSYEDSELEARFSKLGLDLPSTPTSNPSAKPKVTAHLKPKSNLPTYTDDDIDSWCCICNEDGEVRCLGCDGDIYCQNCWQDGHGNGPGQERGHKAVQYNRKPPAAAA